MLSHYLLVGVTGFEPVCDQLPFQPYIRRRRYTPMATCKLCNREYIYDRSKGHAKTKCNSCRTNTRRYKLREQIKEVMGGSCVICGYSKSWRALQCHHTDPSTKSFSISGGHSRSWGSIKSELKKCVLLCSNCHAEVEDGITSLP